MAGSDRDMLDLADALVDAYRAGVPFATIVETGVQDGFTAYRAGYMLGAAVATFAPDLLPQLEADIDSVSAQAA